jgi:integrase/recombinase XerD
MIRETKFGKSRMVPIHSTTAQQLLEYRKDRYILGHARKTDKFFVSDVGEPMNCGQLPAWFRRILSKLDIRPRHGENAPTLHCLRHTFAVNRLTQWYKEGKDIESHIGALSVYLGHVGINETYWYLSAAPDLLTAATERFFEYSLSEANHE